MIKTIIKKYLFIILLLTIIVISTAFDSAKEAQNIKYTYDESGRIVRASYPDGTEERYYYDSNGNILVSVIDPADNYDKGNDSEVDADDSTDDWKNARDGEGDFSPKPKKGEEQQIEKPENEILRSQETTEYNYNSQTSEDIEAGRETHVNTNGINQQDLFKKKKPTIKSAKFVKKKGKYFLCIKIKSIGMIGKYKETGYEVRYANNSSFKRSKYIMIKNKKTKNIISKKIKLKNRKTVFIKVRGFIVTQSGEKIYSKYSKKKKVRYTK